MLFKKSILSAVLLASVSFSAFSTGDIERVAMIIAASPVINPVIDQLMKSGAITTQDVDFAKDVLKSIKQSYFELSEDDIIAIVKFTCELRRHVLVCEENETRYSWSPWIKSPDKSVHVLRIEGQTFFDTQALIGVVKFLSGLDWIDSLKVAEYVEEDAHILCISNEEMSLDDCKVEDTCTISLDKPSDEMRRYIVQNVLDRSNNKADESLIKHITTSTEGCEATFVEMLIRLMARDLHDGELDSQVCKGVLKGVADILSGDYSLEEKFALLAELTRECAVRTSGQAGVVLYPMISDVHMSEEVKEQAMLYVQMLKMGIKAFDGIVLDGKSGVGKTMLAKAIANEAGYTVVYISTASEVVQSLMASGPENIKKFFEEARKSGKKQFSLLMR